MIPDVPDTRDFTYHEVALGASPFDWDKGYDAFVDLGIKPIMQDQGSSSSCTGQGTKAYVRRWLKKLLNIDEEQSAKFIYGPIHFSGGGAQIRDAVAIPATKGSLKESLLSSYENGSPPSEPYMEDYRDDPQLLPIAKTFDKFTYRLIPGGTNDIDVFAAAIRDNLGVVGGFTGTNAGWCRPDVHYPQGNDHQWGHCVDLCAAGRLDVPVGDFPVGTKCVFTKNSWGDRYAIKTGRWAGYQAIPEAYFLASIDTASGTAYGVYVFNSWVLVPDAALPPNQVAMDYLKKNENKLVQNAATGEIGIVVGGEVLVASKERAGQLALTTLLRNGYGGGVPNDLWLQFPKKDF